MAGLGRRTFAAGEVLTASNVMGYLQDQAVMNFAGTAARGTALGTAVAEGMVSYLADSNAVEVYDGSAWKQMYPSVANVGEIIQVVSASYSTQVTTTSDSYVTTNLTASITPNSSTNKIYVIVTSSCNPSGNGCFFAIFKNGTAGTNLSGTNGFAYIFGGSSIVVPLAGSYLDSPATTSSTSYTLAFRANTAGQLQASQYVGSKATITLLEVKG